MLASFRWLHRSVFHAFGTWIDFSCFVIYLSFIADRIWGCFHLLASVNNTTNHIIQAAYVTSFCFDRSMLRDGINGEKVFNFIYYSLWQIAEKNFWRTELLLLSVQTFPFLVSWLCVSVLCWEKSLWQDLAVEEKLLNSGQQETETREAKEQVCSGKTFSNDLILPMTLYLLSLCYHPAMLSHYYSISGLHTDEIEPSWAS